MEAAAVDLQHGDVVVLLVADDVGDVLRAVIGQDLHVVAALHGVLDDVVVREDIAVGADDEAGAGHGAGGGVAPEVGVSDLGADADDLTEREVIVDLGCRQLIARGDELGGHGAGRGAHLIDDGAVAAAALLGRGLGLHQTGDHAADNAAQQRADEAERHDRRRAQRFSRLFRLALGFGRRRRCGVIALRHGARLVGGDIAGVGISAGLRLALALRVRADEAVFAVHTRLGGLLRDRLGSRLRRLAAGFVLIFVEIGHFYPTSCRFPFDGPIIRKTYDKIMNKGGIVFKHRVNKL